MIKFKQYKRILVPILLGIGIGVIPVIVISIAKNLISSRNDKYQISSAISNIIGGAIIRITSIIISKVCSNKQKNQRRIIMDLYNNYN